MSTLLSIFASATHTCAFSDVTTHGYESVMIHPDLKLCEVGQDCHPACPFSFKAEDVHPCPTCGGKPNIDNPPYSCETCDVFGIVRNERLAEK